MLYDGNDERPPPPPNAPRMPSSFPLFWLLIPQILAFVFCENAPWSTQIPLSRHLIAGTCFLLLAAAASAGENFSPKNSRPGIFRIAWKIAFPIAAFFLFCAWWTLRAPPLETRENLPPREAGIVLNVEKTFSSAGKNFNGFARVRSISGPESDTVPAGTRVWFSLPKSAFSDSENAPAEGSVVRARGILSGLSPERFSEPGFLRFLKRERVSALFSRAEKAELLPGNDDAFSRFCARRKEILRENLLGLADGSPLRERAARVFGAMLLGDKSLLSPEQRENFLLSGTMHIFAVSGLHVSILAAGLLGVCSMLRIPRAAAWAGMLAALWFYTQIVGAPPSAVRAWTMLVFLFLGTLFGRGRMAFHGLVFSAFFALLLEPSVLNNTGFQLSYLVVAAILLYGVPLAEFTENALNGRRKFLLPEHTFPKKIFSKISAAGISGFCISLSAFLAGTPIVIADFGFCSLGALIANVILIPLVSVAACCGAAVLVISCVPAVGFRTAETIFPIASIPAILVDYGTEIFSGIPGLIELRFPHAALGVAGSVILLLLFFSGATFPPLRERPLLRFTLPPLALSVFLLIFGI